jgi:formyl-CoA transferase
VIVGVGNDSLWRRFVRVVGDSRLAHPRFDVNADRVARYDELKALLDPVFASRPTADWLRLLDEAGIPVGRVRDVREVFENPQIEPRRMRIEVDHAKLGKLPLTGNPIKVKGPETGKPAHLAPPVLGEHTESVLGARLGLDAETLRDLRAKGVFGS